MSYDSWLEGPYQARASREELIQLVVEDLWNGGGHQVVPVSEELAAAIELVADHLPDSHHEGWFATIVDGIAEALLDDEDYR